MRLLLPVWLCLATTSGAFQVSKSSSHLKSTSTALFSDYLNGLSSFSGQSSNNNYSPPGGGRAPPPSYAPPPSPSQSFGRPPSYAPAPNPFAPAPAPAYNPNQNPFQRQPQQQQQQQRQQQPQQQQQRPPQQSYVAPAPAPVPSFSPAFQPQTSGLVFTPPNSYSPNFLHATLDFFDISKLKPKGPRANADVGQPHDASLKLGEDGNIRSGSWWCAAGGWPSLKQRTTTEIFFVIKGQGCLTDMDGTRHYFGPGDTVILPKGWSGRWDVLEDIHKVWFVHDHPNIEHPTTQTIRVQVANYQNFAPQNMDECKPRTDAIHGNPCSSNKMLYNVGPTNAGVWTCTPGSFPVSSRKTTECFHVLEGTFFLTNAADGAARRCEAGDTVILPKGWSGYWDIIEPVKKLWVEV